MKRQLTTDWEKFLVIHVYLTKNLYPECIKKISTNGKQKDKPVFFKGRTTNFFPQIIFPSTGERTGGQEAKNRLSAWVGNKGVSEGQSNDKRQGIEAHVGWIWHLCEKTAWCGGWEPEPEQVRQWTIHGRLGQPSIGCWSPREIKRTDSLMSEGQQQWWERRL